MKNKMILPFLFLGLLSGMCFAQGPSIHVKVTNPANFSRKNETVSIDMKRLPRHFPKGVKSLIVKNASGKEILSQEFDSNIDGTPDMLLFQVDLKGKQTKSFTVSVSDQPMNEQTSLTDAEYVEPRQDLAWENDRIAFRMYGPALAAEVNNGIDVWTKRVRYLIVKKWYEGEEQTPKIIYHIDHGEGADFFDVGRSLGAGGAGILYKHKLYQPGVFSSYKIISTGPIRACFELYYDNWDINGMKLKETKRISLDAGQNLNRIEEMYTGPGKKSLEIECGLVKRKNTKPHVDRKDGWMSLWGQVNDSLPNGYLGTGVVFSPKKLLRSAEDSIHYLMIGKTMTGSHFVYYAGAGWTRSGDFSSSKDWNAYLSQWSRAIRHPLKVVVSSPGKMKKK